MLRNSASSSSRDTHRSKRSGKKEKAAPAADKKERQQRLKGKEAQVPDQVMNYTVTLKTGAKVDARIGAALMDELRLLLLKRPDEFRAVKALVASEQPAHAARSLSRLLVDGQGNLREEARVVFRAAYREGSDSVEYLDDPFQPANQEEQEALEQVEASFRAMGDRLIGRGSNSVRHGGSPDR